MKILRDQIGQQVYPLHRLDRPTSGVLLFALDKETNRILRQSFDEHLIEKTYWAIVNGEPKSKIWSCREPLQNDPDSPFRNALTNFRLLEKRPHDLALVEAIPQTGRFHQIRRHLLHTGHPIVGDYRYADIELCDSLGKTLGTGTRMLLLAKSLTIPHPWSRKMIKIETAEECDLFQIHHT